MHLIDILSCFVLSIISTKDDTRIYRQVIAGVQYLTLEGKNLITGPLRGDGKDEEIIVFCFNKLVFSLKKKPTHEASWE